MHSRPYKFVSGLLLFAGMLLFVFFIFRMNRPPVAVPADAPENIFSAERAAMHLPHIASQPNPLGSRKNEAVRRYIISQLENMAFKPEIQTAEYFDRQRLIAATVSNVLLRVPGTGSGKAVLIMGHYDSVQNAPGASDNGAAVIAMLEVIRMLKHHAQPENDLIFLFSDGEEYGLLGAAAFLEQHPWGEEIGLVLNLEAMGTSGQSLMFETGYNNYKIIKEFAKAVPWPIGNSLSVEIYNRMPNATDFDVFKYNGYQGLNFAYIGNSFDYHTGGDNIANTDLRSVQHHGSYLAALVLHFGYDSIDVQSGQNAVYFNTLGYGFAYYSYGLAPIFAIIIFLVLAAIIAYGIYIQKIKPLKMLSGFAAFLIQLLLLYVVFSALYKIIASFYPGESYRLLSYHLSGILAGFALTAAAVSMLFFNMIMRKIKIGHSLFMLIGVLALLLLSKELSLLNIAISLAVSVWLYLFHRKPVDFKALSAGALIAAALVMIAAAFIAPGASYLFTWPLLFALIPPGAAVFKTKIEDEKKFTGLLLLCSVPALAWFSMMIYLFILAMGLHLLPVSMIIAGFVFSYFIPHIYIMTREKPWLIPGILLICGLFFLLKHTTRLDFIERHKKQNNIVFATDAATGDSFWFTWDDKPDAWTEQFLTDQPDTILINTLFPLSGPDIKVLSNHNQLPGLKPSGLRVVSDKIIDGERVIELHVSPHETASGLYFYFNTGESDAFIQLRNTDRQKLRPIGNTGYCGFAYFAPPAEGFMLTLYSSARHLSFQLTEEHFDALQDLLADYSIRPAYMMANRNSAFVFSRYKYE